MDSTLPLLIAAGGPAIAALGHALAALPGVAARIEVAVLPAAATRRAIDAGTLARAALVLDEADGTQPLGLSRDERALLPPACLRLSLPRLAFTTPWPLAGESVAEREATPLADRLALQIARAGATPDESHAAYKSVRLALLADLDGDLEAEADLLAERELGCDVQVAGLILSQFRTQRLFHSPIHPAGPLLHAIAAQLLARRPVRDLLGVPLAGALRQLAALLDDAFADCQAPVHPEAAAQLGLAWCRPELRYTWQGRTGSFDEWTGWRLRGGGVVTAAPHRTTGAVGTLADQPGAALLYPAVEVARVAPYFATPIDPVIARHGSQMLDPASSRYRAAAVLLVPLQDATLLGPHGAVLHDGAILVGARAPQSLEPQGPDMPSARRSLAAPAMLGTGPDWHDDPPGIATILPRLVQFALQRRRVAGLRLVLPQAAGTPWLREALALLALDDAVEWLGAEALACPTLLAMTGPHPEAVAPCAAAAARAVAGMVPMGTAPGPRLVFLHHAGHAPRNFEAVAAALHARGFAIADATRLTLAQRILLLRDAQALVAAQGPALSELAFLPPGAAVLELCGPANPRMRDWSLATCAGLRYGYVVGNAVGPATWDGPYDVPLDMLGAAADAMTG